MNKLVAVLLLSLVMCVKWVVAADDGLIGRWSLDGNFNDSSGNGNNGTAIGSPTVITGKFGQAYRFDGTNGIDVGNLDFSTEEYTITGWIRTDRAAVVEDWREWIGKLDYWTGTGPFDLFIGDGRNLLLGDGVGGISLSDGNGPFNLAWSGGVSVVNLFSSDINLSVRDGEWHFIAATYKRGSQKLYANGVCVATGTYSGDLPQNNVDVVIGGMQFGYYHHPWIGDIDQVSIYNRALPATDLGAIGAIGNCVLTVPIDIKPGISPNTINLNSSGVVPVAILSTPTFDATRVDPLTVTLSGATLKLRGNGTASSSLQDVNGDGRLDLVVQVTTQALQLSSTDTEAVLIGRTYQGILITGTDSVRIVP